MCHRQLWDLGNGGCFHSGLRVWLICPSAALHSYCYVFLNHCKYRYSIYIYMYCRYIFICSYIRSLHTLKSWPLEGWKLLFWHEILARRFVRERERKSFCISVLSSHMPKFIHSGSQSGITDLEPCVVSESSFQYESWIWLAISIFFLEFHCGIQEAFQLSEFRCQCHRPHTIETTGTMELLADETVKLSFCTSLHTTYFCTRYNLLLYIYRCCT